MCMYPLTRPLPSNPELDKYYWICPKKGDDGRNVANACQAYRSEVWSAMHNSDTAPDNESAFVRLYIDESGDENPGTPHAVMGGLLLNANGFGPFEDEWDKMLQKHGIEAPLHMREFGQHGRFGKMPKRGRYELLSQAADLIK